MNAMTEHEDNTYLKERVACLEAAQTLKLSIIEAEHHAHTASLPQRIGLEQRVRENVLSDIEWTMGPDWRVTFRFEPRKLDEGQLAQVAFGVPRPLAATDPDLE